MRKPTLAFFVMAAALSVSVAALTPDEISILDRLPGTETTIIMKFVDRPLKEVVRAIAAGSGPFKVTFDDHVGEEIVTVDCNKQTQRQILTRLADEYDLAYEMPEKDHLVVSKRPTAE